MSTGSTTPWWQTSLWITAAVVALVAVAIWAPWPFNLLAVLGAAVYLFLALRNPEMWLRWLARGCITGATASAVVPDFSGRQEWQGGFVELAQTGTATYVLLLVGVALAGLDVWREHLGRQAKPGPADDEEPQDEPPRDEPEEPQDEPLREDPKDPLDDDLRAYFKSAVAMHKTISLAGFETRVRVPIRLQDLYVPLRAIVDRDPREVDPAKNAKEAQDQVGERGMGHGLPLSEAFGFAERHGKRHGLVILGDPGSGKTTHLRRILLKIAHDGAASLGLPEGMVPVFLPLRNLADLTQGLDAFIQTELSNPHLETPKDFGTRLKQRQRILYLLDGLDEVRDASQRAEVAKWIDAALNALPDSMFVVTCRYAGYAKDARLSPDFLELHLQPLSDEQVDDFIGRWFTIVETSLVEGEQRRQALLRAKEGAGKLIADLRQPDLQASARVQELTHNPLLLTTICLVHRDRGKLPKRRADLYDECVNILLERWNEARGLQVKIPASESREVLQPLARWLHEEEGRTRAKEAEIEPELRKAIVRAGLSVEPVDFLRSIRDESGLLTGWGVDEYGFMHLGFQEYLAAREIRNQEILEPGPFWALAQRFGESWWQEVILLMLAQKEPPLFDRFMREVLQRPELPTWAGTQMMDFCMLEAAGVSARPFVEVLRAPVVQGSAERQLAAAQVLARAMPEALEGLGELLAEHPAEAVQRWWRERQEQEARGGEVIVAPRGGVELVLVPGGTFLMGSPEGVGDDDERPQHEVELASFYLARTPVTNAQYGDYLKANPGAEKPEHWGDRRLNHPEQPVVGVSWEDAKAYCEWAGLLLPTEAQWEHACRAGAPTKYSFGDDAKELDRFGWYDGNSGGRLHAVGELEPNAFGLYDMHGNVWEWCEDAFGPYTTSPRAGDGLRHEPKGVANRVVRGGCFIVDAGIARSAYRYWFRPGTRVNVIGFRPAQGHP